MIIKSTVRIVKVYQKNNNNKNNEEKKRRSKYDIYYNRTASPLLYVYVTRNETTKIIVPF